MKILLILILSLCDVSFSVVAQSDSDHIKEFIQEETQRNMSAYNLAHANPSLNGIVPSNVLNSQSNFFYDAFLPRNGFKIKMDIEKLGWKYPIPGYQVYKIYIGQIVHINEQTDVEKKFFGKWSNPYFLVAINFDSTSDSKIKFISGQFYTHAIEDDFSVNVKEPDSCINFLNYKLFEYQLKNIVFFKKKKRKLFF